MSSRGRQFKCCKCETKWAVKHWNPEKPCSKCSHGQCGRCKIGGNKNNQDEVADGDSQTNYTPLYSSNVQSAATMSSDEPYYTVYHSTSAPTNDPSNPLTAVPFQSSSSVPASSTSSYQEDDPTISYQLSTNAQMSSAYPSYQANTPAAVSSLFTMPSTFNANIPMYSSDPASVFRSRGVQKRLPIRLNGIRIRDACADTGSQVNCMSSAMAKKLGAKTTTTIQRFRLPIRGLSVGAFSTAKVKCEFPTPPHMASWCMFFVFKKLACDVIMGRQFLRETRTLDLHSHRLEDHYEIASKRPLPTLRLIGAVEEYVYCWLNGVQHWCLPDTGATVNLISPEAANEIQFQTALPTSSNSGQTTLTRSASSSASPYYAPFYSPSGTDHISTYTQPRSYDGSKSLFSSGTAIEKITPIAIELVDGSEFWSDSKINITVAFGGPDDTLSVTEPFYILEGLEPAVILGGSLLHDAGAYSRHPESFHEFPHDELPAIAWGAKKKHGEGTSQSRPQLTEEQIFRDEYSNICDNVEREKSRIEDQYRHGYIDYSTRARDLASANRLRTEWLRQRRSLVERYWGSDWYRSNVLQQHDEL